MGVHGLWRLIEPSGKPVPLETLENKILAVDISIWLHQAIKGFQDSRGAPLPNAHLLGIYHRICKLLYFRIKPIFVFDGGVPSLKRQTIAKRNQQKIKNLNEANDIQTKLLKTLLKQSAVNKILTENPNTFQNSNIRPENEKIKEDLYKLPELPPTGQLDSTLDASISSDDEESTSSSPTKQWDLQTIDEKSVHFRSLPADVRHEILTEIKETRKQSSWGRIHELPTHSGEFSSFQMKRLLKRYSVQISLEEAEKEMGGHTLSLGELETLLNEEGVVTSSTIGNRIASNENARYLLIKDVQKAIEKAKKEEKKKITQENDEHIPVEEVMKTENDKLSADAAYQKDMATAISLSLQDQPSTSKDLENKAELSYLENFNDADFDSESEPDDENLSTQLKSAKSYMIEYSGLTPNEIAKIINRNNQKIKVFKKQSFNSDIIFKINESINDTTTENKFTDSNKTIDLSKINKIENVVDTDNNEKEKISDSNDNVSEKNKIVIIEKEDIVNKRNNITKEDTKTANISDSEDDFTDVSDKTEFLRIDNSSENKKEEIVDIQSSDSDDTDFIEINNQTEQNTTKVKSTLEIVINPNNTLKDDIFSDIFSKTKIENKKLVKENTEVEVESTKLVAEEINRIEKLKPSININQDNKENEITIECTETTLEPKINNEKEIAKIIEPEKLRLTREELNIMKSDLVAEQQQLMTERNKKERIAGNITDQMYQETQELLELFGVPYITAPMEAEAQCAFLNEINLTDGTITDDSDIWLFGGKTVYKNFFNHNKHVLEFRSESLEHHFKLTREQLILLALLVGSDYTLGIQGIGPVTALEILAAFPATKNKSVTFLTQDELISGLTEFRRWLNDNRSVGVGRTALRSKLRNVNMTEGFPNLKVIQAYLQPEVETCRDSFTWAKPDIVGLIDYAKEKFGWTRLKSEEILKPIMKKLEDKNIQKTIKDYFAVKHKIDVDLPDYKLSKRVKTAITKMGKLTESSEEKTKTQATKKRTLRNKKETDKYSKNNENNNTSATKRKPPAKNEKNNKEYIHQREKDKIDALNNKLKAIEVFRKSKQGPGFVPKRQKMIMPVKENAELSESSSSD